MLSHGSWWQSRFRIVFAAVLATVGIAVTGLAASASAQSQPATKVQPAVTAGERLRAEIKLLDRYVITNADGTLALSPPSAVTRHVDPGDLATLRRGLVTVNQMILAGELVTTAGGRLVDPKAVAFNIQWNWTGTVWYWWGKQYWFNEYWTLRLEQYAQMGSGAATVCAAISAALGQPEGVLICGVAIGVITFGAYWMQAVDNGGGVVISETWTSFPTGGIWISGQ